MAGNTYRLLRHNIGNPPNGTCSACHAPNQEFLGFPCFRFPFFLPYNNWDCSMNKRTKLITASSRSQPSHGRPARSLLLFDLSQVMATLLGAEQNNDSTVHPHKFGPANARHRLECKLFFKAVRQIGSRLMISVAPSLRLS